MKVKIIIIIICLSFKTCLGSNINNNNTNNNDLEEIITLMNAEPFFFDLNIIKELQKKLQTQGVLNKTEEETIDSLSKLIISSSCDKSRENKKN